MQPLSRIQMLRILRSVGPLCSSNIDRFDEQKPSSFLSTNLPEQAESALFVACTLSRPIRISMLRQPCALILREG